MCSDVGVRSEVKCSVVSTLELHNSFLEFSLNEVEWCRVESLASELIAQIFVDRYLLNKKEKLVNKTEPRGRHQTPSFFF